MISLIEQELEDIRNSPHPDIKRKIDLLNDLAWLLRWKENSRALNLSREALALSESTKTGTTRYEKGRGRSLRTLAYIGNRWDQSMETFNEALTASRKAGDILPQPVILARMGFFHGYYLGDWKTAYAYISEALTLAEELGDDFSLAVCFSSLGTIYNLFADSWEALEVFKQALVHAGTVDAPFEEAVILNNYANTCMDLERPDEALKAALDSCSVLQRNGLPKDNPVFLSTLGRIYARRGEKDKAVPALMQSLESWGSFRYGGDYVETLIILSRLYIDDDPALCQEYAEKALHIVEKCEDKLQRVNCYNHLAVLAEKRGDYRKAYHYLKLSNEIRSETAFESAETRIKFFQTIRDRETARKEMEIHRRRAEELRTITEVSREILSTLDLSAVFLRMCSLVKEVLSASIVAFYKRDEDGSFRAVQVLGKYAELFSRLVLTEESGVTGTVIRSGKPELVNDTWIDPRIEQMPGTDPRDENTRIFMSVPLLDEGSVQGILNIWRHPANGFFSEEDLDFIVSLSHQASIATRNAAMHTDLEKAWEQAEAVNRAKSDLLTGVSHEIRTPLNAILGISSVLLDEGEGMITDRTLKGIATIKRSCMRLLQLVNDLLDMSRIEAGRMRIEEDTVNMDTLLEHVRTIFSALQRENVAFYIKKNIGVPGDVVLDGKKLEQIIINLVGNAFKYTGKGSIRLILDADDRHMLITVSDTGVGISGEKLPRVFEPFFHDGRSFMKQDPGSGIGLSLCKSYVDLMKGWITVESVPGEGTTVSCSLPFALPGPAVINRHSLLSPNNRAILPRIIELYSSTAPKYIEELREGLQNADYPRVGQFAHKLTNITGTLKAEICHEISRKIESAVACGKEHGEIVSLFEVLEKEVLRSIEELSTLGGEEGGEKKEEVPGPACSVLVVEDEEIGRVTYRMMLEDEFDLHIAEGGREAIDMYPRISPDIVLLDISMPDMDGYETLAVMKKKYGAIVPVIAVTAHVGKGMKDRVLAAGFDDYISKPLEKGDLKQKISRALVNG